MLGAYLAVIAAGKPQVHSEVQVEPLELVHHAAEGSADVRLQQPQGAQELDLKDEELGIGPDLA